VFQVVFLGYIMLVKYHGDPMDQILLSSACALYNTSADELIPLSGGHYNAVYQFPHGDKSAILRIGVEDCPVNQTLGMLEWVNFLALHRAPVSAPWPSINHHLLERLMHYGTAYTITAFEKVDGILAENIPPTEWDEALFHSIGQATGKMHRISSSYHPSRAALTRPQWFDSYEIREASEKLAHTSEPARDKLLNIIAELKQLPTTPTDFGLIHDDLHFANFLIQPDGQMTIIDFDDCVYGWFAMDIAMALFDVLVLFNATTDADSRDFARVFFSNYLRGYRREYELTGFWQEQIPKFLKLKEVCIYADLIDLTTEAKPGWGKNFMRTRSSRINADLPYVDIDFSEL
jgi:Ser/Thr protein kinase RdoA (MazF antagonist)